jgi:hypothetical protein
MFEEGLSKTLNLIANNLKIGTKKSELNRAEKNAKKIEQTFVHYFSSLP